MIVTAIQEYDKKRVLVQLDGHLTIPLYKGEVQRYGIAQDALLSEADYEEIVRKVLDKRIKLRAMNLLMKHSFTREGLRRKLAEGKYPDFLIEKALDYMESYRYIDDMRYAEEYIRCYSESRSKRRILQDLYAKGVGRDLAEQAWMHYEAMNAPIDEVAQINALLQKRQYDRLTADRKETARMINYLYRKGYSMDNIQYCMQFEVF